jgi:putative membrane protein
VHPVLFVLSGVVIGQVFAFFVYTLTVSFGNVGKALSVILLVVQVAGSGGIFPIEMSGGIYEVLYPFLPFVYGMKALQACVAGIYGMELVQSLAFIVVSLGTFSLLLGLVIRKPIIKFNNFSHEQLSKTKVM